MAESARKTRAGRLGDGSGAGDGAHHRPVMLREQVHGLFGQHQCECLRRHPESGGDIGFACPQPACPDDGTKRCQRKDNAAIFAIAQQQRGDLAGLNAAKSSLDRATVTLDVAIAGASAISDLLIQLKEKATAAADPGIDDEARAF